MICIGRVLTGRMPDNPDEEDFRCFTCSLSRFERRNSKGDGGEVEAWDPSRPDAVPKVDWQGEGVNGGWECALNADCSFLSGGEERGWRFSGDEAFLSNPNAFNDAANAANTGPGLSEGDGVEEGDKRKTSRL